MIDNLNFLSDTDETWISDHTSKINKLCLEFGICCFKSNLSCSKYTLVGKSRWLYSLAWKVRKETIRFEFVNDPPILIGWFCVFYLLDTCNFHMGMMPSVINKCRGLNLKKAFVFDYLKPYLYHLEKNKNKYYLLPFYACLTKDWYV